MKKAVKKLGLSRVTVADLVATSAGTMVLSKANGSTCSGATYSSEFTDGWACTGAQTKCQAG